MGVAVSDWRLAKDVSSAGQLGVVSGTALDLVLVRRLQCGDPGGHMRRAMAAFPWPAIADGVLEKYFIEGGKAKDARFKSKPMGSLVPSRHLEDLLVLGNFVEVWLAKENNRGVVGINFLEKIQAPTLPSIYGAMLAGVDYVLVGAGIPKAIPAILDGLAAGQPVKMRVDESKAVPGDATHLHFDPAAYCGATPPEIPRPFFLAIVSSHVLASILVRKEDSRVDGFIVEAPTAGGHNAPPRTNIGLNELGEPLYGERDLPDFEVFRKIGRPFWLAGSRAFPSQVREALEMGATGVQLGTAFAYCEESGLAPALKERVLQASRERRAKVYTDPVASPTGFPFKVVQLEGTLSDETVYEQRERVCDLGYLRTAYVDPEGKKGWRCASEPIKDYLRKGGDIADTVGRKCLCNALMANVDLGQIKRSGAPEPVMVTSGDDVAEVARFLVDGAKSYTARDVISLMLSEVPKQLLAQPR